MSDRTKTANYRRCYITDGAGNDASGGQTLQALLLTASQSVKRPWLRGLGASNSAHQLLTYVMTKNSCLCGELVYYEPGRKIPLVDIQADGTTWQDTIHPKDATGKQRKFQEQSLYFAIRENHVAVIQSISLQSDELQSFFDWLIHSKAGLVPSTLIALQNLPSKSALEKLKDHKIKGIKFGDRLFTSVKEEYVPQPGEQAPKRKRFVQRIETSPKIIEILLGLGVGEPILESLKANPDPGAIQVDVEISYRSRSEKEAGKILHALASTLGKQDGLETEILLDGKSSIKGEELTIRGPVVVQCPDGCVAMDDALSKLSLWLAEQIKSGKVS
jgi:hypothetical protein